MTCTCNRPLSCRITIRFMELTLSLAGHRRPSNRAQNAFACRSIILSNLFPPSNAPDVAHGAVEHQTAEWKSFHKKGRQRHKKVNIVVLSDRLAVANLKIKSTRCKGAVFMFARPFASDLHTFAAPRAYYSLITIFHARKIFCFFFTLIFTPLGWLENVKKNAGEQNKSVEANCVTWKLAYINWRRR